MLLHSESFQANQSLPLLLIVAYIAKILQIWFDPSRGSNL